MSRPRRRMIDPGIWIDPDLGALSPLHRLLFIATFSLADDEGRLKADPRLLKAQAFPYDDTVTAAEVDRLTRDLADAGLVERYEVAGQVYISHPKWKKHQQIPPSRFVSSELPAKGVIHTPQQISAEPQQISAEPQQISAEPQQISAQGSLREDKQREDNTPPAPPRGRAEARALGGEAGMDGGYDGGESEKPLLRLKFPRPPAQDVRKRLRQAGFSFDGGVWTTPWSSEGSALAAELHGAHGAALVDQAQTPQSSVRSPPPLHLPALPESDPRMAPFIKALMGILPARKFDTWFNPQQVSFSGDPGQVVVHAASKVAADWIVENYVEDLKAAGLQVFGVAPVVVVRTWCVKADLAGKVPA